MDLKSKTNRLIHASPAVRRMAFTTALVLCLSGCVTPPPPQRVVLTKPDVYYGGVYLIAGTQDGIKPRFPALYSETASLQATAREGVKSRKDAFSKIMLRGFSGDLAPNDAIIMGCAFTGERYFSESAVIDSDEVRNVRAYLGGELLLQHFIRNGSGGTDIKLLACYPFSLTCIGLVPSGQQPKDVGGNLLLGKEIGLGSDAFRQVLDALAGKVAAITGLGATMQIRTVTIAHKADAFVAKTFGSDPREFSQWLAGELGAQLSKQVGIPLIPFAEDTSSRKMAQMMESGSAYNITLPEPQYTVDVELQGFSRAKAQETRSESAWVYGAYAKFVVRESATGKVQWEKEIKAGVVKKIAATQTMVDHSMAEFSALSALLEKMPRVFLADESARPLIESCLK